MRIEPNESKYVYVDSATLYGGYPNVSVNTGEVYSFSVNPLCKWRRKFLKFTAGGTNFPFAKRSKRRVKSAPYFALCGTINKRDDQQFLIGLKLNRYEVTEGGQLNFFANKARREVHIGSGYVILEIERIK
ncbi:MAG: hypothetical protein COA58_03605 [Bacteroidetes bacterium]|nr:MAG: hypothetical protein COA58_03605 [Bacteroidota bacterium]